MAQWHNVTLGAMVVGSIATRTNECKCEFFNAIFVVKQSN